MNDGLTTAQGFTAVSVVKTAKVLLLSVTVRMEATMPWAILALLSALFAALTAILGKIGVQNIDSNLAVAIRTSVVLVLAWGLVLGQGSGVTMPGIPVRSWLFLVLSGLATGCSWLCYYRALQLAPASRVAPLDKLSVALTIVLAFLMLGEPPTLGTVVGGTLITAGALVVVFVR